MKPILLALVLSIAGFNASSSFAQPATAPAPTQGTQASDVAKKPRAIPFHGNLTAVNAAANTLTVGKRVFTINTATKLYKGDKTVAGSWKDAVVGGKVTGSYFKTSEGKLLAVSVYFK